MSHRETTSYDPDLQRVFEGASAAELAVLAHGLEQQLEDFDAPEQLDAPASRRSLHDEVLRAGGHLLGNLVRGHGPRWDAIVRAIAGKLDLETEFVPVEDLEQQVTTTVFVRWIGGLAPEERAAWEREYLTALAPAAQERLRALIDGARPSSSASSSPFDELAAALLAAGPPADPTRLDPSVQRLESWLRRRKVRYAAVIVLMKLVGIGTGPVGMGLSAAMLTKKLAGPRYALCVPVVLWVAFIRARLDGAARGDARAGQRT